jgi:energy-converting hydrogenase Eha subunit C
MPNDGGCTMIRLAILQFGFCCFLAWAWYLGYVGFVFTHDISHLSYLISGVFVVSIARLLWGKTDHLLEAKEQLTGLGLIGTLIGFVLAMYGLSQTGFDNPDALTKAGNNLMDGLGVAFCSSLVGAVCSRWIGFMAYMVGVEDKR